MACADSPQPSERLRSEPLKRPLSEEEALPRADSEDRSTSVGSPECVCSTASSDSEDGGSRSGSKSSQEDVFRTDSQITGAFQVRERDLKRWQPASGGSADFFEEELEDMASTMAMDRRDARGKWNQFEENKARFGVESTFKSDLSQYSTALDVSKVPLSIRERAERVAKEIEAGMKSAHDHDGIGSDGDDDEEGLWSAVPRNLSAECAEAKGSKSRKKSAVVKHVASGSTTGSTPSSEGQASVEEPKVRGTFVLIDGVGIVREQEARSMPGVFNVGLLSTQPPASVAPVVPPVDMFPAGTAVVVDGLVKCPAFNGCCGIVQSFDPDTSRYNIDLLTAQGQQLAKVKAENLRWYTQQPPPVYQ